MTNQAYRIQMTKYHRNLAAAYRACGQETLAKLEDQAAAKLVRASYKEQALRA